MQPKDYRTVQDQETNQEALAVTIVNYEPKYHPAFKSLNEAWISNYFKMEAIDYKSLDHPNEYILAKGGAILVALAQDEPVGVCALIQMGNGYVELAKMAVADFAKGKGIGENLGRAAIEKAKAMGAKKIYLESNTVLAAAIQLYNKLGFEKETGIPSPYERCNIQMTLTL